ncbi:O-antigen ligase family protein [Gorillibacterium sp. sgz5001074]|uniref:O-antigen ligase family protein n=1 Tax=Gorillibacterium sp. sgz5001074 TaxID=3446695 RepID=UPI003F674A87
MAYSKLHGVKKQQPITWLSGMQLTFTLVILLAFPFYKGLFNGLQPSFDKPILVFCAIGSVALLTLSYAYFQVKMKFNRNNIWIYIIWLLPLWYLISALWSPASFYSAILSTLLQISYATTFVVGFILFSNQTSQKIITYALLSSSLMVMIFGLCNWYGFSNYTDAVLQGTRLSSVFQYPNSYAAYLTGLALALLIFIIHARNPIRILLGSFFITPTLLSIFLTGSRGAIVLLPFITVILLVFLNRRKQLLLLAYLLLALGGTLTIFTTHTNIRTVTTFMKEQVSTSLLLLLLVSAVIAVLFYLLHKFTLTAKKEDISIGFNKKQLMIPLILCLIFGIGAGLTLTKNTGFLILPDIVESKFTDINFEQDSVLSRAYIFKDSISIANDYPIFGAGGGASGKLSDQYSSYPYISKQSHNYYLQLLVEVGYPGFLITLALLITVYWVLATGYHKKMEKEFYPYLIVFIFSFSILVHSLIDFDMSFAYLSFIVFLSLGCIYAMSNHVKARSDSPDPSTVSSFIAKWHNKSLSASLVVVAILVLFVSVRFVSASNHFDKANKALTQNQLQDFITHINRSIDLVPSNSYYSYLKGTIFMQVFKQTKDNKYIQEAGNTLDKATRYDPFDKQIYETKFQASIAQGDLNKALLLTSEYLPHDKWDIKLYERLVSLNYEMGVQSKNGGKDPNSYWKKGIDVYNDVNIKTKQLMEFNKNIVMIRPFYLTPSIIYAAGSTYYAMGDYATAARVYQFGVVDDMSNELTKSIIRQYLISLKKSNQSDPVWYDKFVKIYPSEVQEIEKYTKP